ncbi:MAG TPA: hypothetical protein VJV78_07585 [Polyangiales bacterium]|nr:hypothetical protein [Polyangiales bacterium]
MTSRTARLSDWLDRLQRGRAQARRGWLQHGELDQDWVDGVRRLLSDEGEELWVEAQRERAWSPAELRAFEQQRAHLAFRAELARAAGPLTKLAQHTYALPFGREQPQALVTGLLGEGSLEGREQRAAALARATEDLAPRLMEIRARALERFASLLKTAEPAPPDPLLAAIAPPPPAAAAPAAEATPAETAEQLLAATDDAALELTRWLVRNTGTGRTLHWHVLLRALRAPEYDGLVKPARRWVCVAQALRGLGFERDLNARLRAESAANALDPRVRVLALDVPGDIRVVQSATNFGLASDVYAAQGAAAGLALALVSPALPNVLRWPLGAGVADALGVAFMQLRADRGYLSRLEGLEAPWLERAARHAAILVLLEARLQAALVIAEREPAGDENEQARQLTAALERALCAELPPGVATLFACDAPPDSSAFEAVQTGLGMQMALRERFDEDWYRNPRVADVLRGAATRANTLALAVLRQELNVAANAGSRRLIELLE